MNSIINKIGKYLTVLCIGLTLSCSQDFLDTVPDNITALEDVFTNKGMTEQWLARIYNPLPDMWDQPYNQQWAGQSDEADYAWVFPLMNSGAMTPDNTNHNVWSSYYQAIRYAAIFLENVDLNKEIPSEPNGERLIQQYKGEARFLRAYYYWLLMRQYGPVVLMGEVTLPPDADFQIPRSTWDDGIEYVLSEMDIAMADVPEKHLNPNNPQELDQAQTGRISKPIIKAIKSQILLFHASPLVNGNGDLSGLVNPDGTVLINQNYDENKWKRAADAAKEVIDLGYYSLFKVEDDDPFRAGFLSYRNLMFEGWRTEGIWLRANSNMYGNWERHASPRNSNGNAWSGIAVPQEMVDAFRMSNGLTINNPNSGYSEDGFVEEGNTYYSPGTFNMYVDREPRFYVNVTFNGSYCPVVPNPGWSSVVEFFYTGNSGKQGATRDYPSTGYTARKNIHPNNDYRDGRSFSRPAMNIRLGEIYLNYIEALNEYSPGHQDIFFYLNELRNRSGLPDYEGDMGKDAMRKVIHIERQVELMFEGHRYWDVRRWKVADQPEYHQGGAFHGMNIDQGNEISSPDFHKRSVVYTRADWEDKNYWYPVPQSEIDRNKQLVQNPGY